MAARETILRSASNVKIVRRVMPLLVVSPNTNNFTVCHNIKRNFAVSTVTDHMCLLELSKCTLGLILCPANATCAAKPSPDLGSYKDIYALTQEKNLSNVSTVAGRLLTAPTSELICKPTLTLKNTIVNHAQKHFQELHFFSNMKRVDVRLCIKDERYLEWLTSPQCDYPRCY